MRNSCRNLRVVSFCCLFSLLQVTCTDSPVPDVPNLDAMLDDTGLDDMAVDVTTAIEGLDVCVEVDETQICGEAPSIDLGDIPVGMGLTLPMTFRNVDAQTVTLDDIDLTLDALSYVISDSADGDPLDLPLSLSPGDVIYATVTLAADTAPGALDGEITLTILGDDDTDLSVTLSFTAMILGCEDNTDNCDDDWGTGCEADFLSDEAHCGGCDAACGNNEFCRDSDGEGVCVCGSGYVEVGGACVGILGAGCGDNSDCQGTCVAGACGPTADVTGACDDDDDCVDGLICGVDTCVIGGGGDCLANDECEGTCLALVCDSLSVTGGACDEDDDEDCELDNVCIDSVCLLVDGQSCDDNDECSGVCVDNLCAAASAVDGMCDENDDCEEGLTCTDDDVCLQDDGQGCADNATCAGVCIELLCGPPAATGGACDETDDCQADNTCFGDICVLDNGQDCDANSECLNVCVGSSCADPAGSGGVCDESADCLAGNACEDGVCRLENGRSCSANDECSGVCVNERCGDVGETGGVCDESADCVDGHACTDGVCLLEDGEACELDIECANVCIDSECAERSGTGADCNEHGDCQEGHSCDAGTCLLENGRSCGGDEDCLNSCVDDVCTDPSGTGAACDDTVDCESDHTCTDNVCLRDAGEPCVNNGQCIEACVNQRCVETPGTGDRCDETTDCAAEHSCSEGVCRLNNGQVCGGNDECDNVCISDVCASPGSGGDVCDDTDDCQADHVCNAGVCGLADGQACSANDDCSGVCINSECAPAADTLGTCDETGDCSGNHECAEGVCLLNEAEVCGGNDECLVVCITAACAAMSGTNGACDERADCDADHACVDGQCLLDNGQGCTANSQCHRACIEDGCADASEHGGACDETADCGDDLLCVTEVCRSENGDPCDDNADCAEVCIAEMCASPGGTGDVCDATDDCSANHECSDGACLRVTGQSCDDNSDCLDVCVDAACGPVSDVGEPCDEVADCDEAMACQDGGCVLINGETCVENSDCEGVCIDESCADLGATNDACDETADCDENLECTDSECLLVGGQDCGSNEECVDVCVDAECGTRSATGSACDEDPDCVDAHGCDQGTCRRDNGQDCADDDQCLGVCLTEACVDPVDTNGFCDDTADCAVDQQCVDAECLRDNGQGCQDNGQCIDVCIDELCTDPALSDGSCDETSDCLDDRTCVDGDCLRNNGLECDANSQCVNVCIDDTCVDRVDNGALCDETEDCVDNNLCIDELCLAENEQPCGTNGECANVCVEDVCSDPVDTLATCDETQDCAGNSECIETVCVLNDGETCEDDNTECVNVCINESCAVPSATLDACDENDDCVADHECVEGACLQDNGQECDANIECVNVCVENGCADPSATGGVCDQNGDCAEGNSCLEGECNLNTGGDCTANDQCVDVCIDGSCASSSATNESCDEVADCLDGHVCDEGECLLVGGEECVFNSQCDDVCVNRRCAAISPNLDPCDETADCETGNVCDDGTCLFENDQVCESNDQCLGVCIEGSCADKAATNGTCDESVDCVAGNVCDEGQCLRRDGQMCAGNDQCENVCVEEECSQPSATNETCDEALDCVADHVCEVDECLRVDGQLCNSNGQCENVCVEETCSEPSDTNGMCDENFDCVPDHVCSGDECLRDNGQSCDGNGECDNVCIDLLCADSAGTNDTCDETLDCEDDHVCQDDNCLRINEEVCNANGECANVCIFDFCNDIAGTNGTCDETADCAADHACVDDECLRDNGQECIENSQCQNVCVEGFCADASQTGGACDEVPDCVAGHACSDDICLRLNGQGCDDNGQCDNVCVIDTCASPSPTNGVCDQVEDCNGNHACSDNECLLNNDEGCDANSECLNVCTEDTCSDNSPTNGACDETADCVVDNVCTDEECLRIDGQDCDLNSECLNVCVELSCAAQSATNGTCDETPDCEAGNACVVDECLRDDGEGCEADSECQNVCLIDSCGPLSDTNGPCDETSDCQAERTCADEECLLNDGETCDLHSECLNECVGPDCGVFPAPTCVINLPSGGVVVGGRVGIDLTAANSSGRNVEATFEYDAGGGFVPATDAGGGSINGNPTAGFGAGSAEIWTWDSPEDIPGTVVATTLRVTVADIQTGASSTCTVSVDVDNTPACEVIGPDNGATLSAGSLMDFTSVSRTGNELYYHLEYDGGAGFSPATDGGGGTVQGNPTAPTSAGTEKWHWDTDSDIGGDANDVVFRVTATDNGTGTTTTCSRTYDIRNAPSCVINAPSGGTWTGTTTVDFTAAAPSGNQLAATVEYDVGGGFVPATDAGVGSLQGNPTAVFSAGNETWAWQTTSDVIGVATGTTLRVTVRDTLTGAASTCTESLSIDNRPGCTIDSPTSGDVGDDVLWSFTMTDPHGDGLDLVFDYDVGGGFGAATDAGGGTITGNPARGGAGAETWEWASSTDFPADMASTTLRVTVDDGQNTPQTCTSVVTVDNRAPSCAISWPAAGGTVGGSQLVGFSSVSATGSDLTYAFEYDAGGGFETATEASGGSIAGNPTAAASAGAESWAWDVDADLPSGAAATAFRITVTDASVGKSATCSVAVDVPVQPSCEITSPTIDDVTNFVLVGFTGANPAGNSLTYSFEYDAGSGFRPATDFGGGSLSGNPTVIPVSPGGETWEWDTSADIRTDVEYLDFRAQVTDTVTGASNTCQRRWNVPNQATCTIEVPDGGSAVSGDQFIGFTTVQPSPNGLDLLFEYDTGSGFRPATDAGGGTVQGNPVLGDGPGTDTWEWSSRSDVPGDSDWVVLRLTVSDAVFGPPGNSTCETTVRVRNAPSCEISSPTLATDISGTVGVDFTVSNPSGSQVTAVFTYDWRGELITATDAGTGAITGNPAGPFAAGAVDWGWDAGTDGASGTGVPFYITVTDTVSGLSSTCANTAAPPSCSVTAPSAGAELTDAAMLSITGQNEAGNALSYAFHYDAGNGYQAATDLGGGTVTGNPSSSPVAPGAVTWEWDTDSDILGDLDDAGLRVTVTDSVTGLSDTCRLTANVRNQASCGIDFPAFGGVIRGDEVIRFVTDQPADNGLNLTLEYDTGSGFSAATVFDGDDNPVLDVGAGSGTFGWDSATDIPGDADSVLLRLSLEDVEHGGDRATCQVQVAVQNAPSCVISTPAPGADIDGTVPVGFSVVNPAGNNVTATIHYADGTMKAATDAGGGTHTGNPIAAFPAGLVEWNWDADADGRSGTGEILRVTVQDATTGATSTCSTASGPPSCEVTAPPAGGPVVNFVLTGFTGTNPTGNPLIYTLDYHYPGSGWMGATDFGGGSVFGNPTVIPVPAGPQTWEWDTSADIRTDIANLDFRVRATDSVTGDYGTCQVRWDVPNQATCSIDAPARGSSVTGDQLVSFTTVQPSPNGLDLKFEYDIGSGFQTATDAGGGSAVGNPVLGDGPGADTWEWASGADIGDNRDVRLRLVVTDAVFGGGREVCEVDLEVQNAPSCEINAPSTQGVLTGDHMIDFDVSSPLGNTVSIAFDYDAGAGFGEASDAGGGTITSPATGVAAGNETWEWELVTDVPGNSPGAAFRITVTDDVTGASSTCTRTYEVANGPTCTLIAPTGTVSGNAPIVFDAVSLTGNMVTASFRYDSGSGYSPATDSGAGSLTGNPTSPFAAAAGWDWSWASPADIAGLVNDVSLEVTVTDTVTMASGTCTIEADVDNRPPPPSCTIGTPSADAEVSGDYLVGFNAAGANRMQAVFEFSLGGPFFPAAGTPPNGTVSGNPTGLLTAGAQTWRWDSDADIPTMFDPVTFRVTLTEMETAGGDPIPQGDRRSSFCTVASLDVDNTPTCAITSPAAAAQVAGDQMIGFTVGTPSGNAVDIDFEYNTNGGSFMDATDALGGGINGNPVLDVSAGATTWEWDSKADIPTSGTSTFRITVTDSVTGAFSQCTVANLAVANLPSCSITSPSAGADVGGDALIGFNASSPAGNGMKATLEWSLGGPFFAADTGTPVGSVTGNLPSSLFFDGSHTWRWNSDGDIPTMADPVTFRVTVTETETAMGDPIPFAEQASSSCTVALLEVDNTPTCGITFPTQGFSGSGTIAMVTNYTSPSGNLIDLDFEYSTGGPFMRATDAGGGAVAGNPAQGVTAGNGIDWTWDTAADIPGNAFATFRITTTDAVTGAFSQCTVTNLDIQNAPVASCPVMDCHFQNEVDVGEGFDLGQPAAATLLGGITTPQRDTSGSGDLWCAPPGGMFGSCTTGPTHGVACPGQSAPTGVTQQGCGSFFSDSGEHMYKLTIPAGISSLTVSTCGSSFDSLLTAYSCAGTEVLCADNDTCGAGESAMISVTAGEDVFIMVEGNQGGAEGTYTLSITGSP